MITPFDIFKCDISNEMLWIEAVSDLEIAKARVAELMQAKPCPSSPPMAIVRGEYAIRQWRNA
jgi:hypothetical protein